MNANTRDALIEFILAVNDFVQSENDPLRVRAARVEIDIFAGELVNRMKSDETIIG